MLPPPPPSSDTWAEANADASERRDSVQKGYEESSRGKRSKEVCIAKFKNRKAAGGADQIVSELVHGIRGRRNAHHNDHDMP